MNEIWLIPLLPAAGAVLNGVVGTWWFSRGVAAAVACGAMAGALGVSTWAFGSLLGRPVGARVHEVLIATWIPPIPLETATGVGTFEIPWALRLDPLSALMILVVTGVGFLIHVYATAYMQDEPRAAYARFFSYLNLFCFFMLMLVLGGNVLVMFVGWEGVGLCSYLLIGFWYEKRTAADAGKKAFITNRIGDWAFVLGIFLIFFTFGTLDFTAVAAAAARMPVENSEFGVLSTICLLLFIGAIGKSAQIPLHVWLPDAMEGPTPVSALIHAATMVTAGVYMVARTAVLFSHAPLVLQIVGIVGVLTALMAATIALVQTDIKRVLAYSTISQLGYMFLALGVGAFGAAIFHLMTHAFFKALLFLGSGAVIHAMAGEQDMQRMGGLRRYMPVTFVTMMVGTLAIAGIPPFSGFFSKDEILYRAFLGNRLLWTLAIVTALLTALYMFRVMALTFLGTYRGAAVARHATSAAVAEAAVHGVRHPADAHAHGQAQRADHEVSHGAADVTGGTNVWHGPHEAPSRMTAPLMALAVGAIVAGFFGVPPALGGRNAFEHFLAPSFEAHASTAVPGEAAGRLEGAATTPQFQAAPVPVAASTTGREPSRLPRTAAIGLTLLSLLIAVLGILLARHFYLMQPELPRNVTARWPGVHALLFNKYYVDELYDGTIVRGTLSGARHLWTFDRRVVDGAVHGSGALTQIGAWFSHMADKYLIDGFVNSIGWTARQGSHMLRRLQTGLVQNYALLMLLGIFGFLTVYLFAR